MKARKPDRFERMVTQLYFGNGFAPKGNWQDKDCFSAGKPRNILKLLRRQHRAYVRMVKSMPRVPYLVSDSLMRSAVIEALKQYAK